MECRYDQNKKPSRLEEGIWAIKWGAAGMLALSILATEAKVSELRTTVDVNTKRIESLYSGHRQELRELYSKAQFGDYNKDGIQDVKLTLDGKVKTYLGTE